MAAVTWNPADCSPSITLSNGNLTATNTASVSDTYLCRATQGYNNSGKYYFEIFIDSLVTVATFQSWGISTSATPLSNVGNLDAGILIGRDLYGYFHGSYVDLSGTFTSGIIAGSVVQIAADFDNHRVWIGVDNVWAGEPGLGTNPTTLIGASYIGDTFYPCAVFHRVNSDQVTARFVQSDFTYAPPSGFSGWEETPQESTALPAESITWNPIPLFAASLPVESLSWSAQPPIVTVLLTETIRWSAQPPIITALPAESMAWPANAPLNGSGGIPVFGYGATLPTSALTWTAQRPQQTYDAPSYAVARAVYRCILTGDAEDPPIADVELPLASFQSRRRNGEQTYLAITVPNPAPYIESINARLNGDIVIYSGFAVGIVENLTELLRVNFGSFRYDLGARSGTASLSGHKQVTYSNPKTRALSGISYQSVTDGVMLVRCEPDMWLNPGDTADTGGSVFVVDTITYIIKPTLAYMEVQEVSE